VRPDLLAHLVGRESAVLEVDAVGSCSDRDFHSVVDEQRHSRAGEQRSHRHDLLVQLPIGAREVAQLHDRHAAGDSGADRREHAAGRARRGVGDEVETEVEGAPDAGDARRGCHTSSRS
jgi:hypothetical protein